MEAHRPYAVLERFRHVAVSCVLGLIVQGRAQSDDGSGKDQGLSADPRFHRPSGFIAAALAPE